MLRLTTLTAVALPLMWAAQRPPQPAYFSQALACGLWAIVVAFAALQMSNNARLATAPRSIPLLWGLLLLTAGVHWLLGWTPGFLLAPVALNLMLAELLGWLIVAIDDTAQLQRWLTWLLAGILLAALFNAFAALLQTVAPNWTNDSLIALPASLGERAVGNLRQPNQLATLMVWGMVAATHLLWSQRLLWLAVCAALATALLLSGSRTGVLSLLALLPVALVALRTRRGRAAGACVQRSRSLQLSVLLLAIVALAWAAMHIFGRDTADASLSQRMALWQQTLALIGQFHWTGVGWSQLNFVWTLSPFADRAPDVFDHAHNLPLHLAAELGVPVTLGVFALLLAALWPPGAWHKAATGPQGAAVLSTASLLAAIALHSLFEYPLWFSYFLLPTAFLLATLARLLRPGNATKAATKPSIARASLSSPWPLASAGALALVTTLWGVHEYNKASAIHYSGRDAVAQARAVDTARASPLYGQYGDYAAIMLAGDRAPLEWFARPIRNVLDERLLTAWARALQRAGQHERAAWVVARAREFPPDAAFAGLPQVTAPLNPASAPRSAADFRR